MARCRSARRRVILRDGERDREIPPAYIAMCCIRGPLPKDGNEPRRRR